MESRKLSVTFWGMDEDDFSPKKQTGLKNLAPLSIAELEEYIVSLKEEITRVEQDIARKKAHAASADMFFKKP